MEVKQVVTTEEEKLWMSSVTNMTTPKGLQRAVARLFASEVDKSSVNWAPNLTINMNPKITINKIAEEIYRGRI